MAEMTKKSSSAPTTTIPGLLSQRGPTTIPRFIVTVIVDSVERLVFGGLPHIGEKILEGLSPTVTDRYAPTAVKRIEPPIGVVAPLNHSMPCLVSFCAAKAFAMAVLGAYFDNTFNPKTAARTGRSPFQPLQSNNQDVPTITRALPSSQSAFSPGWLTVAYWGRFFQRLQFAKSLSSYVDLFHVCKGAAPPPVARETARLWRKGSGRFYSSGTAPYVSCR